MRALALIVLVLAAFALAVAVSILLDLHTAVHGACIARPADARAMA